MLLLFLSYISVLPSDPETSLPYQDSMETTYPQGSDQKALGTSTEVKASHLPKAQEGWDVAKKGKAQMVQREELVSVKSVYP